VPALDAAFAEVTRDLARHLLDRPLSAFDLPDLRMALALTAQHSERFWRRCGHWMDLNHAYQLRAQAANTLGEGLHAVAHAREGLAVLDKQGVRSDDDGSRAFLQLELAQGLRLAKAPGADEAQRDAELLAALFADTAQIRRFAQRMQRHADLTAHYKSRH
jgi:predicted nucleotidyltransferase